MTPHGPPHMSGPYSAARDVKRDLNLVEGGLSIERVLHVVLSAKCIRNTS